MDVKRSTYEAFILALSLLSLVNIVLVLLPLQDDATAVVYGIDAGLTIVFIGDFLYRFFTVPDKSTYFFKRGGWLDLLGSLPFIILRLARIVRIIRSFRRLKQIGWDNVWEELTDHRAETALYAVVFGSFVLLEASGLAILVAERGSPNANIRTGSDALWWGIVTMTTVGYGDHYPVTQAGRTVAIILMISGIGLFAVFTGFLANLFLARHKSRVERVTERTERLEDHLEEIERLLRAYLPEGARDRLEQADDGLTPHSDRPRIATDN